MKTRLIPAVGAAGAAALHRRLVLRTLRVARAACDATGAELEIRFAGGDVRTMRHWLGDGWLGRPQAGDDLGERMAGAFEDSFREGSPATVLIGTDCPALTAEVLGAALAALDGPNGAAAVLGPAVDGGYYLIGLKRAQPELFRGIPWGTDGVLARTEALLEQAHVRPVLLPVLSDLDRPEDLAHWTTIAEADEDLTRISVVIPALNEAGNIGATLESVGAGRPHELIVVDGGSRDDTAAVAQAWGATVVASRPGRACQMNAGAARATGGVLLFLHADTVLPARWPEWVRPILARPGVVAGAFAFSLSGGFRGRRLVEWTANLRSRWGQSPYGDQALFLRRSTFEELGGFAQLPILEDYELNRRLRRRGRIVTAGAPAVTADRRWQRLGVLRTSLINKLILGGFWLGVSPARLARFYRPRDQSD